jgi:hypothetical protein
MWNQPADSRIRNSTAGTRMIAKRKPQAKTYHATMLVTRIEEWCVEAESAEEAEALLAAGQGHRCHPGEVAHFELERMLDDA